jgi:hypothetical protein
LAGPRFFPDDGETATTGVRRTGRDAAGGLDTGGVTTFRVAAGRLDALRSTID